MATAGMNIHATKRLTLYETPIVFDGMMGKTPCVLVNAIGSGPFPSLITASMLLVNAGDRRRDDWVISHLLVEDEARRLGFGTEVVRFYEDRLGEVGACWASDTGIAFANGYVKRFGERPHWRICEVGALSEDAQRLMDLVEAVRSKNLTLK